MIVRSAAWTGIKLIQSFKDAAEHFFFLSSGSYMWSTICKPPPASVGF